MNTMRHLILIPWLAALLLFPASAPAADLEWGLGEHARDLDPTHENLNWGFRNDAWGTEKDDIEDRHMLQQCAVIGPALENCVVTDANLSIGPIPLQSLRYIFFDEKFAGVALKYPPAYEKDMFQKIVELLGDPSGERDSFPVWELPYVSAWASDTHFSLRSKRVMGQSAPDSGGTF